MKSRARSERDLFKKEFKSGNVVAVGFGTTKQERDARRRLNDNAHYVSMHLEEAAAANRKFEAKKRAAARAWAKRVEMVKQERMRKNALHNKCVVAALRMNAVGSRTI